MKTILCAALVAGMATSASAGELARPTTTIYEPTFFAGFTWSLGGLSSSSAPGSSNVGFTLKYLTTNEPDTLAASVGVTLFLDGSFGCDAGLGLNHGGASLGVGYDFCRSAPTFSFGAIKTPETTTTLPPS